jgi:protein TonB
MGAIASLVTGRGAFAPRPAAGRRSFAGVALLASALVHAAAFVAFGPLAANGAKAPVAPTEGPALVFVALAPLPAKAEAPIVDSAGPPPAGHPEGRALRRHAATSAPGVAIAPEVAIDQLEGAPSTATAPGVPSESFVVAAASPSAQPAASTPSVAAIVPASYLSTPEPAYPASAREDEHEGVVVLRVRISRLGQPEEIVLDRSSGFGDLDRAAIEGVKRWSFTPARRGDEAIEAWMRVPIRFRLG